MPWRVVVHGYKDLLARAGAQRTYVHVLLNATLQPGVFTWLGGTGVGLALPGYGIPGLLLSPVIGKLADR